MPAQRTPDYPIVALSEGNWAAHKSDCSGFVRAVALAAGIPLHGDANALVDYWSSNPGWSRLGHDSARASLLAAQGYLVVAGRKEAGHGHVVIVVPGRSSHGDAMGYWGRLGGIGAEDKGLGFAWKRNVLSSVEYFARPAPALKARQ